MSYSIITLFRSCYGLSRLWEFKSVTSREYPKLEIDWNWEEICYRNHGGDYGPSIIQPLSHDLSASQWANIGAQCVGNRAVFQIVGEGETLQDCIEHIKRLTEKEILELIPDTWSIKIKYLGKMKGLNSKQTLEQIGAFREVLSVLKHRRVDLENPDSELCLLKDCRRLEDSDTSSKPPEIHYHWLLKRVKPTVKIDARQLTAHSDIKKRAFIGTTTLPSDRALMMANLAKVSKDDVVLDPFCGAAGLLLSASLLGAKTVGGDLNVELLTHQDEPVPYPASPGRPLRGSEKVSFNDSFTELSLKKPKLLIGADIRARDVVVCYLEANHGQAYDAIITDPPYGIRETRSAMEPFDLFARLCEVGSQVLKTNGRLVLLHLIDGGLDNIQHVKQELLNNVERILIPYHMVVHAIALEKFNTRYLRATIVLIKDRN